MYRYLNTDAGWTRTSRFGMEIDEQTGALLLRRLPGLAEELIGVGTARPSGSGTPPSTSLTTGPDGTVFIADPGTNQVWRLGRCEKALQPLLCPPNPAGWAVGQVDGPRAALFDCKGRLLVADTGHHRVLVLDPFSGLPLGVWGQPFPHDPPKPRHEPGWLREPSDLTQDAAGNVYVVVGIEDTKRASEARVRKFGPGGVEDRAFGEAFKESLPAAVAGHTGPRKGPAFVARFARVVSWTLRGETAARERLLVVVKVETALVAWLFPLDGGRPAGFALTLMPEIAGQPLPDPIGLVAQEGRLLLAVASKEAGPCGAPGKAVTSIRCYEAAAAFTKENPEDAEPIAVAGPGFAGAGLGLRGSGAEAELLVWCVSDDQGKSQLFAQGVKTGYRTTGAFLAGPVMGQTGQPTRWHRLRIMADGLPGKTQVQFMTLSASSDAPPPRPLGLPDWLAGDEPALRSLGFALDSEAQPTEQEKKAKPRRLAEPDQRDRDEGERLGLKAPGQWHAGPVNQFDFLTRNGHGVRSRSSKPPDDEKPADRLWVLGLISGSGADTPFLRQARVEFDDDGWLALLPEYFQSDPAGRDFLRRFLALLEAEFEPAEEFIDGLAGLASPVAVKDRFGGRHPERTSPELAWLAGWLGLQAQGDADGARRLIEKAPALFACRGTRRGLRELLKLSAGVDVEIVEPGVDGGPLLAGAGMLGAGSVLAGATREGTRVGTAVLGQTRLSPPGPLGPPLFADDAHRIVIRVAADALARPGVRAQLESALERLAPAHLCWSIEEAPVGFVVGGSPMGGWTLAERSPARFVLDSRNALGVNTTLGDAPPPVTPCEPRP